MAELYYDDGIISQEDEIISDEEDDIIEEPADDPTIPTEDDDGGAGGDPSATESVTFLEDDEEDDEEDEILSEEESDDIEEYDVEVEDEDEELLIDNSDDIDSVGAVEEDDDVLILMVDGEPVVLGKTGSGDEVRAQINELYADYIEVGELVAEKADIEDLEATDARIDTLEADTAKIHNLTAQELSAATGYVADLTAGNVSANNIIADHSTVGSLDANYAQLNGANITSATLRDAWIDKLMVQSGLIAHSGTIYTLDAIQVNASKITAGTIDVQRLIVTVNNHKYMVQFDSQGNPTYQKLDGDILEDLTVTADKIVAGAITADKITTNNIVGSGGWINLRNGTFNYSNATTGNYIRWDGSNLYLNADNLKIDNTDIITVIEDSAPSASVTQTSSGATITVTDSSGTTTANIANGSQGATGPQGPQGEQGESGVSSTITTYRTPNDDGTVTVTTYYDDTLQRQVTNTQYVYDWQIAPVNWNVINEPLGPIYPITPNYTFAIEDMLPSFSTTGFPSPKVGDLIECDEYRYTISSVGTTTVFCSDRMKIEGTDGNDSSIAVSKTGDTATITATSGDGTVTTTTITDGADGNDGNDGKSAYESAVDGGYTGTETAFNSDLADLPNKVSKTIIREYSSGVLVAKTGNTVGVLINSAGSVDVVEVTWSGTTPTAGSALSTLGGTYSRMGQESSSNTEITASGISNNYNSLPLFEVNTTGVQDFSFSDMYSKTFTTTAMEHIVSFLSYVYNGETFTVTINASSTSLSFTKGTAETITSGTLKISYNGSKTLSVSTTSGTYLTDIITTGTAHEPSASFSMGIRKGDTTRGKTSLAAGHLNTASGDYSASFGSYTEATDKHSFAQGYQTVASGENSHAEGYQAQASGLHSHAEGYGTYAIANMSHAEGRSTTANGLGAHAEGYITQASGNYSHAEGYQTIAASAYQTVIGQYNSNSSSNIFEVGIGTATARKNGFAISTTGAVTASGALSAGSISTTGALSAGAISSASSLFVRTNHSFTIASIAKDSTSGATTKTFTKSGYYPVGVVGSQTGGGKITFSRMQLTSASSGSATITYNAYNHTTTASGSLSASVDILWVKTA